MTLSEIPESCDTFSHIFYVISSLQTYSDILNMVNARKKGSVNKKFLLVLDLRTVFMLPISSKNIPFRRQFLHSNHISSMRSLLLNLGIYG